MAYLIHYLLCTFYQTALTLALILLLLITLFLFPEFSSNFLTHDSHGHYLPLLIHTFIIVTFLALIYLSQLIRSFVFIN